MARPGLTSSRLSSPVALAVALGLGIILTAAPSTAAPAATGLRAAATPGEFVLPAAPRAVPRAVQILNAGTTGFLWAQEGEDRLLWTNYAAGTATALGQRLPAPVSYDVDSGYFGNAASFHPGWYGTGSDTVAIYSGGASPHVSLQDGASGGSRDVPLPAGHSYRGTFGDTVLTRTGDNGGPQAYHLWRADAGGVTSKPVTGIPAGADEVEVDNGDARSVILRYKTAGGSTGQGRWGLLDLAGGGFTRLPEQLPGESAGEVTDFRLSAESVLRFRTGRMEVDVFDRRDLSAPVRTVDTGSFSYDAAYGMVGSTLLAVERVSPGDNRFRGQPLWAIQTGVAEPELTEVMDPAAYQIVQAPDGSALAVGAERFLQEGDLDWGVYRITQAADGSVKRHRLTEVQPMPAQIHGLALGNGILTTAGNSTGYTPSDVLGAYRSTWLTTPVAGGTPAVEKTSVDGRINGRDGTCGPGAFHCIRMFADGTGFHGREAATYFGDTMVYANGTGKWGPTIVTGYHSPQLADLSGRYAVINSAPRGSQSIGEFRAGAAGVVVQRRSWVPAAVWGSTLWSGAASGGVVTATRLPAGSTVETFTTPDDCTLSELQAVGRWVYWACEESWAAMSAGVYDRTSKRTIAAPAGEVLLGDGYLVERVVGTDADGLKLIDLRGAAPSSRMLVSRADLGRTGGPFTSPRSGWTVDRFGGGVAYADDQQRVHLVPTGVPASDLSAIDATVTPGPADWSGTWWLSKPAASWQVVFRDQAGATLRTVSGSATHGLVRAAWDGKDSAGRAVADGAFTWTLTAQPADGQGAVLTVGGGAAPAPAPTPPATLQATKKPSISGTVAVGSTVRAVVGTWTPAATSYTYRWSANGVTITGATGASYPVAAAMVGKRLAVTVTARRAGHPSGTATSAASAAVAKGKAAEATTKPKIIGTPKVGRTVRVAAGTWSPKADSYRYEWRLNGKLIRGATGSKLKLKSSMRTKKITVTVIARKAGHADGRSAGAAVKVRR